MCRSGQVRAVFWSSQFWDISFEGVLIGCVVAMIGAIGPSLDASRTVTVRALAPGDYEASRQSRVGDAGGDRFGTARLTGLLSLTGPSAACRCWLSCGLLSAGWLVLSRPALCHGVEQQQTDDANGTSPAVRGAFRKIAIDHARRNPGRNGVTVSALNGRARHHDRRPHYGPEAFAIRSNCGSTIP